MLFHGLFHLLNFSEEKFLRAVGVPKLPSDDLSQVVSIINLRPDEHIKLVCSISAESYFNEQSRHARMRHGLELLLINDGAVEPDARASGRLLPACVHMHNGQFP